MQSLKENKPLMRAIHEYADKAGLTLPHHAVFEWGIDCVGVFVDGKLVLSVGLPPVSNYPVRETEHTRKYLCKRDPSAVAV